MAKPTVKQAKKAAQRRAPAPRMVASAGGQDLDNTIWIVEKVEDNAGKPFRVHPSPKEVRKNQFVYFQNLTKHNAVVIGRSIFEGGSPINVPAGEVVPAKATGEIRMHAYKVRLSNDADAHGNSDPDIIIVP